MGGLRDLCGNPDTCYLIGWTAYGSTAAPSISLLHCGSKCSQVAASFVACGHAVEMLGTIKTNGS